MKKILLSSIIFLALLGCKSEIDLPVKYSQVFGKPQPSTGTLSIEVPDCKEEATEMESSSVLEAKQKVNYIFSGAKYLGCKEEGFESFVSFEVPFIIGCVGMRDCRKNEICVASSQNNQNMNVFVGEEIRKKITLIARGFTFFDPDNLRITLTVDNDSGQSLSVRIPSAFLRHEGEEIPLHNTRGGNFPEDTLKFTLSNVASSQLIRGRGVATAMEFPDREYVAPPYK